MRNIIALSLLLVGSLHSLAQATRVAILDFDNISGIVKYDGLGKAMSSMLISDIEANVSPKRLQLVERAQIQKVLKEQNFQNSGSVNKSTAVQAGKILGVNYLLVGDVYILNDQLIINVRLTNVETGDIVFSKKQEGKTVAWLTLKTNIAKDLATSLSQPFTEPTIPDKELNIASISTFGNAIKAKDEGDYDKSEILCSTIVDFYPDFKYIDELISEINRLKLEIEDLKKSVNYATDNPIGLVFKFLDSNDILNAEKYFLMEKNRLNIKDELYINKILFLEYVKSLILEKKGQIREALKLQEEILNKYPYHLECRKQYLGNLVKIDTAEKIIDDQLKVILNNSLITSKIADTSRYKHIYVGNGISDEYVISLGYNNWIDKRLSDQTIVGIYQVISSICFENKNFQMGEKYFNEALKYDISYGLLTTLSWLSAVHHRYEYAIKIFNRLTIDEVSKDLMSVINFAHIFLILKDDQKAIDLYCWAIQNNYGRIANIRDIIIQDHLDLKIKSTINLNCQEKIILTKTDKSIKFIEEIINSKISYKNGESEVEFIGNGEVILKQSGDIFKGKVSVGKGTKWIQIVLENYCYLPYFNYGYPRNDYEFELTDNAKYIIPVSNINFRLEKTY